MSRHLAQLELDFSNAAVDKLPGVTADVAADPKAGFGAFVGNLMGAIMTLAALLVLVYLLWGAIEWITSGGDKGKVDKARTRITQAVIGIIVLASTTAIFVFVQKFLGID